ncbi:MAG: Holliday junction resolvase RuvX [Candidatus Euphemobacter frigidus]|nr:Holliday junction resolvase RuvX [Candidatus Euphemobacter frigidus]MDP8275446.1 Holliday junction resolvase RuvX [Candidatus Euphemobacter frigidus]
MELHEGIRSEVGRILGIDPGEKRIGLALSDPLGITAQGLETLQVTSPGDAVQQISEIARQVEVSKIIIGLPLNMDGSKGEQARRAQRLGARLEAALHLPVLFRDERLTSRQAEQVLIEANLSRRRRREKIDRMAAQLILQNYLDASESTKNNI